MSHFAQVLSHGVQAGGARRLRRQASERRALVMKSAETCPGGGVLPLKLDGFCEVSSKSVQTGAPLFSRTAMAKAHLRTCIFGVVEMVRYPFPKL